MEQEDSWPAPPPPDPELTQPAAAAGPPDQEEPTTVMAASGPPAGTFTEPASAAPSPFGGAPFNTAPPHATAVLPAVPVESARPRGKGALVATSILAVVGIAAAIVFGFMFMGKSSDNSDLEDQLAASEADYSDQSKTLADTKKTLDDTTKTLTDTSGELASTKTDLDQTTQRATDAEGKVTELTGQVATQTKRADAAETQVDTLNGQVTDLTNQLGDQTKRADQAEQTLEDAKKQFLTSFKNLVLSFENPMTAAQATCVGQYLIDNLRVDELMMFVANEPGTRAINAYFDGKDACGVPTN